MSKEPVPLRNENDANTIRSLYKIKWQLTELEATFRNMEDGDIDLAIQDAEQEIQEVIMDIISATEDAKDKAEDIRTLLNIPVRNQ